MIQAMIQGVVQAFTPEVLLATFIGIAIALVFGIMPALGAATAVVLVLPFTFGMSPFPAFAMLTAIASVTCTGDAVCSILFGIPGSSVSVATIFDGFPMTKKGEGGRALGAALGASGLGGIFGGLVLAALIPVSYTIIMAFGLGELFLVGVLGLSFVSMLAEESQLKGLASGLIGMIFGLVGPQAYSGMIRYNFGTTYLYDGLSLVPLVLGLFALPEVLNLSIKGGAIADVDRSVLKQTQFAQMWQGVKDVFRHWGLFLRSSAIGALIGVLPAVGGASATFLAYGQAKQTSKHPELFGKGSVEGVIAPQSAVNSCDAGDMLCTLAFGIPGSSIMAILMGAFLIHGITPGPPMLKEHLDLTWTMITTLIFANVLLVLILFPLVGKVANIAFLRGRILVPILLILASFGAYASRGQFLDIIAMLIFGGLGYGMAKNGYSRPAMVLGFVLSDLVETYFLLAYGTMGFGWLLRPLSLVLLALIFYVLFAKPLRGAFRLLRRSKA